MSIQTQRVHYTRIILKALLLNVETILLHLVVEVKLVDPAKVRVLLLFDCFNDILLCAALKVNI